MCTMSFKLLCHSIKNGELKEDGRTEDGTDWKNGDDGSFKRKEKKREEKKIKRGINESESFS